jgi:hypothetical protein
MDLNRAVRDAVISLSLLADSIRLSRPDEYLNKTLVVRFRVLDTMKRDGDKPQQAVCTP